MRPGTIARNAALALLYLAVARLGLQLDAVSGFATLVWPASGLALAALVRFGVALWPGIAIGAFAANLWVGAPVPAALGIAAGNTLEALLAALMLRRLGFDPALGRVRDAISIIVICALLSTVVSATIGVASLWLAGVVPDARVGLTWQAWWLGDAIGDLIVAPLLLAWGATSRPFRAGRRLGEAVVLAVATALAALTVYDELLGLAISLDRSYLLFPFVIWAALRFEVRGATAVTFLASAIAIFGTSRGHGPFVEATLHESLIALQAFMIVLTATALLLGAAIAERHAAERRAVAAIRIREEFLAVASHELRTPLTALILRLGAARRTVGDLPDAAAREVADKLERTARSANQLTHLINDLLDVSRIAEGRLVLSRAECDLVEIARDAIDHAGDEARHSGSVVSLSADEPVRGSWDRPRIEQVIVNLLSNATKYGSGKPIVVSVAAANGGGLVSVRDQGIGIPELDRQRIFERFERACSMRNYGGLGLGLYISREIVVAHGGTIRLESAVGAGACFTVELPRQ